MAFLEQPRSAHKKGFALNLLVPFPSLIGLGWAFLGGRCLGTCDQASWFRLVSIKHSMGCSGVEEAGTWAAQSLVFRGAKRKTDTVLKFISGTFLQKGESETMLFLEPPLPSIRA